MIVQDRIVQQFVQLVQIDSETRNERAICDTLIEKFNELGLSVYEDDTAARTGHGAGNLFAVLEAAPGQSDVPAVFFTAHMDTVAPGQGIKPVVGADGYIRSDGTTILGSDDKAGLASILEAIRVLREQDIPHGKIQFVITVGEELGLVGSRAIDSNRLEAKFGFALDSTGEIGEIAVSAPSRAEITMKVFGKSAHAGVNPEDGISAVQVASKAISRMPLGRIDKDTTANIGRFEGGGATNIVCDFVKIDAEARSMEQDKLDRQLAAMKEALESAAADFGARAEFISNIAYPAFRLTDDDEVVQLASAAIASIGKRPSTFQTGGGSDANIFNGMGIPTVNLAVGYEDIHTTNERIKIENLVKTAEMVVAIVKETAKRR